MFTQHIDFGEELSEVPAVVFGITELESTVDPVRVAVDAKNGILKDLLPLAEDQVGTDQQTAPLVTFGKEGKEHLHLLAALLNVSQVIQNDGVKAIDFFQ